jgi:tryptophan synthase alpha subunit
MSRVLVSRIETRFRELRERQAKGLVVYFTAGDPTLEAKVTCSPPWTVRVWT